MAEGIFAKWQPQYAKCGIPTFPVGDRKVPAVRGYLNIALASSNRLVPRFTSADAFGFVVGSRAGLTILDVDSRDERLLRDCLVRHGDTPVLVRTGSGNFQAWYKHNGETRRIRPYSDLPVDVLGGGYVVAPPSRLPIGQYAFIRGSLEDLRHLPQMRHVQWSVAGNSPSRSGIPPGARNDKLFRFALRQARYVDDEETLLDVVMTENEYACSTPLGNLEVRRLVGSAWRYQVHGRNFLGQKYVPATHSEVDDLVIHGPDALALLLMLRRTHFDRSHFALAKALAAQLGWTLPRFRAARQLLEDRGYIQCLHRGGRGGGDPPIYALRGTDSRPNKLTNTSSQRVLRAERSSTDAGQVHE